MHRSQGWSSNCRFTLHRLVQSMQGCVQDDQSACNFFSCIILELELSSLFMCFKVSWKHDRIHSRKKKETFFFRVDIRSKLASARFRYAIAYSACCKGLAFHCLLMSELMFGLKDMTGGARMVRGIDAILAKKKHEQRI